MKFIFGFIAIATASGPGSIAPNQISIKRGTTAKLGLGADEIVSNDATQIMVHESGRITFLMNNSHQNLLVIGEFGNAKEVADSIEKDFSIIVAAMKSFNPNMGDDSVGEEVSAVHDSRAYGDVGVTYVAYVDESSKSEVLDRYSAFRFNCVRHKRTINEYFFRKHERMPYSAPGPNKVQHFQADAPEYAAGFSEALEAATKHCQSVYKLVSSAPSLRKAVLGLDN